MTSMMLPTSVLADPSPGRDVTRMVTDDCARARKANKTCVLEVPPEDVNGEAPGGSNISVGIITFGTARSLIRLRLDFIPEILKTAEDL